MSLIASALTAGASLLGGVLGYNGQKSANLQTLKNVREQNRFAEQMWTQNNAYNTPYEQRRRYEMAGINPYMAMGNIQAGNAQGVVTPSPAPAENALGYLGQGISQSANTAVNAYLQNQLISSQVEKNLAEADATKTDAGYIGARNEATIANTKAGTRRLHSQTELDRANTLVANASLDRLKQMTPVEVDLFKANAEQAVASASYTRLLEKIADWDLKNLKPLQAQELKAKTAQAYAMIGYLVAQGRLSQVQAELVSKQVLTEISRRENVVWDTMLKKDDFAKRDTQFWRDMDKNSAETQYLRSLSNKTDDDNARSWSSLIFGALGMPSGDYSPSSSSSVPSLGMSWEKAVKNSKSDLKQGGHKNKSSYRPSSSKPSSKSYINR